MENTEYCNIYAREFKDEGFEGASVRFEICYISKLEDRQHIREVDETLSVLADRINKGGEKEMKRLLRVIEAYLEGGDE